MGFQPHWTLRQICFRTNERVKLSYKGIVLVNNMENRAIAMQAFLFSGCESGLSVVRTLMVQRQIISILQLSRGIDESKQYHRMVDQQAMQAKG